MCKLNVYLDCETLVMIELNIEKEIKVMILRKSIKEQHIYIENNKKFKAHPNPPYAPYFYLIDSDALQDENQQLNYTKLTKDKVIPAAGSIAINGNIIVVVSNYQYTQPQQQKPDKVFTFDSQQEPKYPPLLIPGGWWPCDRIHALLDPNNTYFCWDMAKACDIIWSNTNSATKPSRREETFFLHEIQALSIKDSEFFASNAFLQDQFVIGYCFRKEKIVKVVVKYPRDRPAQNLCSSIRGKLNIDFSNVIYELTKSHKTKAEDLDNSFNFGGNILVSPPVKKVTGEISKGSGSAGPTVPKHPPAPFGKIIVGDSEKGLMGDILRIFLTSQKIQPILPIDTSWLKVGHVDEFLSFIPDKSESNTDEKFKALYADPDLMIFMLEQIKSNGDKHRYNHFFLGKYNIEKQYAEIGVENLLKEGIKYNQELQQGKLIPIKERLQQGLCLENKDFISIPIFFLQPTNIKNATEAVSVNVVNLQFVNGHVLVPRPFGPRLLLEKAKSTVKNCLEYKKVKFDVNSLAINSKITDFYVWHDEKTPLEQIALFYLNPQDAQQIDQIINHITKQDNLTLPVTELRGSLCRQILEKNPGKFVGKDNEYILKETANILIPEETQTADVIELYLYAIFKSIGIPETNVHFIDDWAYHINAGEIHCGTVAERSPPQSFSPQAYSEVWSTMLQHELEKQYVFTYDPNQ